MCSSKDTVLLSNLSLSRPIGKKKKRIHNSQKGLKLKQLDTDAFQRTSSEEDLSVVLH